MIGTRLAHYQITSHLGTGGMGEVYRAQDLKLKRSVAIKVLPAAFSLNVERIARFQREAEVLALLNHPHIAGIYDLVNFDGCRFLVLELVEGETLASRIARGPIPIDEAIIIARQIAQALEAAHEKGITHRDLKPANIKLTTNVAVKVLDFGLAKVHLPEDSGLNISSASTLSMETTPGMIRGTAAYMPPEQAMGGPAHRTADVWAFGCVLYEMLTGRRVFEGETMDEILVKVMRSEPNWSRLPAKTPEGIRRLLSRCLRKESRQRLQYIGDARIELDDVLIGEAVEDSALPPVKRQRQLLAWIGVAAAVVVALAWTLKSVYLPVAVVPAMSVYDIQTPPSTDRVSLAISPDGQQVSFAALTDTGSSLWVRSLDTDAQKSLAGTEDASYPFWSPDNQNLAFFADDKLKTINIKSEEVKTLATVLNGRGGAWNQDGTIIFAGNATGISRVSVAVPNVVAEVTKIKEHQLNHRYPQFLPDGRHFLYFVQGEESVKGVYVGQLDSIETVRVLESYTAAVYESSGQLLYVNKNGILFAQDFDLASLRTTGKKAEEVAHNVAVRSSSAALSASAVGSIVYRTGPPAGSRQFVWVDRIGTELEKVGDSSTDGMNPSLSDDGSLLALDRDQKSNLDVCWLDLKKNGTAPQRLTYDPQADYRAVWSPGNKSVVFSSNRTGIYDLYRKAFAGGDEELVLKTLENKTVNDLSVDGHYVLYRSASEKGYDLMALQLDGDGKKSGEPIRAVFKNDAQEREGQFSPDGKWIAYQSNESDHFEIYMEPFPPVSGRRKQVSREGGTQVRWGHNGELFYIALADARLMRVSFPATSNGWAYESPRDPEQMFVTHIGGALQGADRQQYAVFRDDNKFLMNTVSQEATLPIKLILNRKKKAD